MTNMDVIQMQNGAAIGLLIYELRAGTEPAARKRGTWLELLHTFLPFAPQRDAALELLFAAGPEAGGALADAHIYLIAHKYGGDPAEIRARLEGLRASLEASLAASGIDFAPLAYADAAFCTVLRGVRGSLAHTVLRPERLSTDPQSRNLPYGDPLAGAKNRDWRRLLEALRRRPGTAVSFQLIPTRLTSEEQRWLAQLLPRLSAPGAAAPAAYYRRLGENPGQAVFLFGLFVYGDDSAGADIANIVQTALQYDDKGNAAAALLTAPVQALPGSLIDALPGLPWNALNELLSPAYRQYLRQPQTRFASLATPAEAATFFHAPV